MVQAAMVQGKVQGVSGDRSEHSGLGEGANICRLSPCSNRLEQIMRRPKERDTCCRLALIRIARIWLHGGYTKAGI